MKSRKGFTLVELLAVIAILAILVIIALPNVISMYNRAQKQTFLTEAKKVYSEAEKKYLTNAISGKNTKIINSEDSSKLDMTGKKLQYCVILNNNGKVTDMKVSNGKWIASLNGKAIEDLTIDDLEDGNLDDYECGNVTNESCFTYENALDFDGTFIPFVTVEDEEKCKVYLMSDKAHNLSERNAESLCTKYKLSDEGITIHDLITYGFVYLDDYNSAGLNVKYINDESITVNDIDKCKNYLKANFNGFSDDNITKLCTTNERVNGSSLKEAIIKGYISIADYENIGISISYVSSNDLNKGVIITKYDTSCGLEVNIPSKLNGKKVVGIGNVAFIPKCYLKDVSTNSLPNTYKAKFLNNNTNNDYIIKKLGEVNCDGEILTSVTLPNTVRTIGYSAFARNDLKEIVIPSSVKYIGGYSFRNNQITSVIYNGEKSSIQFKYCPYLDNKNYSGQYDFCPQS